ncbi:hypothetical protein [Thalassiella azotivora]
MLVLVLAVGNVVIWGAFLRLLVRIFPGRHGHAAFFGFWPVAALPVSALRLDGEWPWILSTSLVAGIICTAIAFSRPLVFVREVERTVSGAPEPWTRWDVVVLTTGAVLFVATFVALSV